MKSDMTKTEAALQSPHIQTDPGQKYATESRRWQGIPGIECDSDNRLWATWYSGGDGEGPENYVLLVNSEDEGQTWSKPLVVIDPPGNVRAFDPVLWIDPLQRLWWFWAQSDGLFDGRAGVWGITLESQDAKSWSAPRRLCDGIMMNKPIVLASGEWMLPVAVWGHKPVVHPAVDPEARTPHVVVSADGGQTWERRGGVEIENRSFDEHMIIERHDNSLWLLTRLREGIGESTSDDKGYTWSPGRKTTLTQPDSRFFIRRLNSGNLLLVKHHDTLKRSHLTAFLSTDDGQSWQGGLLLDERAGVSYPDGAQVQDGRIFIIYDRDRYGAKEVLLAVFREEDILKGNTTRLQILVNKIGGAHAISQ